MGLFDFFLSPEKKIQKQQRTLTNRDVQPEDREGAARWLANEGSPKALVALLTRFSCKPLENQLKEKDEKELVYALLANLGDATLRPLEHHMKKHGKFAWPIRLYVELTSEEQAVEKVLELLEIEYKKDEMHKPRKKVDMLVWLTDKKHPRAVDVAAPFLNDFDESVRYAAAEVMLTQDEERIIGLFEAAMANPEEESNRLKVRLCEVFQAKRWPIENAEALSGRLPLGYTVIDGRIGQG